jgi:hypothetical protein
MRMLFLPSYLNYFYFDFFEGTIRCTLPKAIFLTCGVLILMTGPLDLLLDKTI